MIPLKVTVAEVVLHKDQSDKKVSARLHTIKVAQIHFEVASKIVLRQVKFNMYVVKNEVLLSLEKDDYQKQLEQGVAKGKESFFSEKNLQL